MAQIIDGRAVAAGVRGDVARDVVAFEAEHGRAPGLATILVGDDPASAVYVASKRRACAEAGIESFHHPLPATTTQATLHDVIDALNADARVSGILCQLPLPDGLDEGLAVNRIDPAKDVDGLTVASAGRLASGLPGLRPCTPSGVMLLIERTGLALSGAHAVVVGRSNLFGKPMAQLLLAANATVTTCHSRTRDLAAMCARADVLIAAVGRPCLIGADAVRPGAVVIDVGINRTDAGLVGDVDFAAVEPIAGHISPVPGGVGPMTIACLLANTVEAARSATADRSAHA